MNLNFIGEITLETIFITKSGKIKEALK